jgi:hypothetical protein
MSREISLLLSWRSQRLGGLFLQYFFTNDLTIANGQIPDFKAMLVVKFKYLHRSRESSGIVGNLQMRSRFGFKSSKYGDYSEKPGKFTQTAARK